MKCLIFKCRKLATSSCCCHDCTRRDLCADLCRNSPALCRNSPALCGQSVPDDFASAVVDIRGYGEGAGRKRRGRPRKGSAGT